MKTFLFFHLGAQNSIFNNISNFVPSFNVVLENPLELTFRLSGLGSMLVCVFGVWLLGNTEDRDCNEFHLQLTTAKISDCTLTFS